MSYQIRLKEQEFEALQKSRQAMGGLLQLQERAIEDPPRWWSAFYSGSVQRGMECAMDDLDAILDRIVDECNAQADIAPAHSKHQEITNEK